MKFISRSILLFASLVLASCGGGGGGGSSGGSAFQANTYSVSLSASATSLAQNSTTSIVVTIKSSDNTVPPDGTAISLAVSPAGIGTVGTTLATATSATASASSAAGSASFIFVSASQAGTAHITASVTNPGVSTVATGSLDLAVSATSNPLITISPASSTLPVNAYSVGTQETYPFPTNYLGSPFVAELAVEWRHANGQLVSGSSTLNVSITPVTLASFSTLDNPATAWTGETATPPTTDGNEFLTLLGSGQVTVTGGVGTLFVHAGSVAGTAQLSVTGTDPDTGQNITAQSTITIAGSATGLPTSINISQSSASGVYVNGSNGSQSELITASVSNGNGGFVADPSDGQGGFYDNVQFSITGPAGTDATLTAVSASGKVQTGSTVYVNTHSGIASVTFNAGVQQGPVQVQASADRSDNNVDNGIPSGSAVTATTTVVVSDGKLYSLTLTSPVVNAILVNGVSEQATLANQNGSGSTISIPPAPDATYSLTVSALGNDRQGNPVLPGTSIAFGNIDAPLTDSNAFAISGVKGIPQVGGTAFNAADGLFTTAGGGAGPGDTLLVFGKAVAGNDDLETAAKVKSINSATSLTTNSPFNLNDTSGVSTPASPLPYIIGRAQAGNITSPATTNTVGVASTTLNYPVSQLERAAAIWAQGTGVDTVTGGSKTITDIAVLAYPGLAPAAITISPSPIPGGTTIPVEVCIADALSVPLPYIGFTFDFSNLGIGTGSVDGISTAGTVPDATGPDGCVVVQVTTSGIAATTGGTTTNAPTLTFNSGPGTTKSVTITASGTPVLLATPSALGGTGGTVSLQLLDSSGTPIPGQQLVATCTGDTSISITSGPGTTDTQGKTSATIVAALNKYATPGTGTCSFSTSTGTPTATVTLQGTDLCLTNPGNFACGGKGLVLNANPSALAGMGGTVTLTLVTSGGVPVPGVALSGTCTGPSISITSGPGTTNASGQTSVSIQASLNTPKSPGSGTCTFTTASGTPTTTVNLQGTDPCITNPQGVGCGGLATLSVSLIGSAGVYGSVNSTPAGIACVQATTGAEIACSGQFTEGSSVALDATLLGSSTSVTWTGSCSSAGTSPVATLVLTNASYSCTATFK